MICTTGKPSPAIASISDKGLNKTMIWRRPSCKISLCREERPLVLVGERGVDVDMEDVLGGFLGKTKMT